MSEEDEKEPLRLRFEDVPLVVIYHGPGGRRLYELRPGGKTNGLSLQAAGEWTKRQVEALR